MMVVVLVDVAGGTVRQLRQCDGIDTGSQQVRSSRRFTVS